ncbi:MAG: ABC transporter substrate-binding protein [Muribaculaceae bacterium]
MKQAINYVLFILLVLTTLSACKGRSAEALVFDREVYTPEYASGFAVRGNDAGSLLVTVTNPWQGADSVTTNLLVLRGDDSAPEGFDGQVLKGDAHRIIAMSSTHVAMLDAVGEARRVIGVSGKEYISNPTVVARRDSVCDVGYEGNIDYETLVALKPDIVLLYGINNASSMEGKLREADIPFVYVGDYLEQSPLGKAEWLVMLSELMGVGDRGRESFAEIADRYNELKATVAADSLDRPAVMLNAPYSGTWFLPPVDSYSVTLINDAGGRYIYDKNTGNSSEPVDIEEAYMLASQADVWLNAGSAGTAADLAKAYPKFGSLPVVKEGRVYNNILRTNAAGGNDYYESGVVRPDLVLRDLIKIFHPDIVANDFVYYKRLE